MKYIIPLFLIIGQLSFAQVTFNGNSNTLGRGTGVSASIDYFAVNTNPSNLGWQSKYYAHKLAFKIFDFTTLAASPVSPRYAVNMAMDQNLPSKTILEIVFSYDDEFTFDTTFPVQDRLEMRDMLMQSSTLKFNRILFGASYTSPNHGTFAIQVNNEITGSVRLSENTANLFMLGKINPYFDSLVLQSGQVIANDPMYYTNDILTQISHAFSNDTLTIGQQLDGSYFKGMRTRNYSMGWGKGFQLPVSGWETYLGATLNLIEGQEYYDWYAKDGDFFMKNVDNGRLGSSEVLRNPGFGTSVGVGVSFIKNDKWILGASLNNVGFIRWREKDPASVLMYNSVNDTNMFHYPFGTSDKESFYDQLYDANMAISLSPVGTNYLESGRFTSATAANLSLGAQWRVNRGIAFSSDLIVPLNPNAVGSYRFPYFALGAEVTSGTIGISSGINTNFNALNVPVGLTFGSLYSRLLFTLATNNILVLFQDNNKMRNNSLAVGMTWRLF